MSKKVLIVGLGIAGMASAVALSKQGFEVKIIERAKDRRTGGYFLGIMSEGQESAKNLGVWDSIHTRTPSQSQNWEILADGSRIRILGFADTPGKPETLLRGDVEAGLWANVVDNPAIEICFDTNIRAVKNIDNGQVLATLIQAGQEIDETFDLLIGADGVRSTVRKLAFGDDKEFLKPLNKILCAFQLKNHLKSFDLKDGIILSEPNRALWVFPLEDHTPTALFTYHCDDVDAQFKQPASEILKGVFANMPNQEIVNEVLENLDTANDYLFDSVNMVKMPKWTNGRIILLGDSAWCMTLYSGMGASGGLIGADKLGQAIAQNANLDKALNEWEKSMRPFIEKQQMLVKVKKDIFVPSNGFVLNTRRALLRLLGLKVYREQQQGK